MSSSIYFCYMTTHDLLEQLFGALSLVMDDDNPEEMVEFINRNGIQPGDYADGRVTRSQHPLCTAIHNGQDEHFHVLRNLGFHDDTDTLFTMAASVGNLDILDFLLEQYPNHPTETVVEVAAYAGHQDTVDFLLSEGATVDIDMSLISAAKCHREESRHALCRQFLYEGANVSGTDADYYQNTALHFAALHLDHTLVELLLDAGADINETNVRDETPFMVAANRDTGEYYSHNYHDYDKHGPELLTAKLLVSRGADLEATSTDGRTALHFAVGSPNLLHYLLVDLNLPVDGDVEDLFKQAADFPVTYEASINVLMSVGYYPKNVDVLLKLTEDDHKISPNPKSLQNLCCFKIRQVLGGRLPSVVDDLPLPAPMKDFVRLSHIPQPPPV